MKLSTLLLRAATMTIEVPTEDAIVKLRINHSKLPTLHT